MKPEDILNLEFDDPPTMRQLGQALDWFLGNVGKAGNDREGFILVRFKHGKVNRPKYISTCAEEHTIRMLKLMLAQLEGRITGEEGNA